MRGRRSPYFSPTARLHIGKFDQQVPNKHLQTYTYSDSALFPINRRCAWNFSSPPLYFIDIWLTSAAVVFWCAFLFYKFYYLPLDGWILSSRRLYEAQ
jgi:hypothetical protein